MGYQYNVPVGNASEGRTETGPTTPFRERTRSEDIEIARKRKLEDPIAWAGRRGQRLQQEQQAVERAKAEEDRKRAYAEHVERERVRVARAHREGQERERIENEREAKASRDAFEQRILKAKEKENTRRRLIGLPPLPEVRS